MSAVIPRQGVSQIPGRLGLVVRQVHRASRSRIRHGRVGSRHSGEYTNNNLADLLLGDVYQVMVAQPGPLANPSLGNVPHLHFVAWAPYFQDDIKASPRLTLNLGLRYDFSGVATEEQNHFAWFNPSLPGGGLYLANQAIVKNYGNGYYVYDGRRSNGPAPRNVWAPRVGFAYRLRGDGKTVVRGGYGLFYDTSEPNEYEASTAVYPLAPTQQYTSNKATGTIYNSDNLFPTLSSLGPVSPSALSFLQIAATKKLDPYNGDWSFGVEREVLKNTILDIDYVGNKGTHLNIRTDPNQPTECILVQPAGPGCAATITNAARSRTSERSSTRAGTATRTTTRWM
jgi:TonB dependent receptor